MTAPPSLYQDVTEAEPDRPALEGEHDTDVAIVGAGFTGLSAALHLAERGRAVCVLEAQTPGWGASGRNGGQVNPGLKHPPDQVEADWGADLGARMVRLAHGAPGETFALIRRLGIACDAAQTGTLRLATHARGAASLRDLAGQCRRRDMPITLLEGAPLHDAVGSPRHPLGLLDPRGGTLNPLAYARGLARAAQDAGAALHAYSPALGLRPLGDRWELDTPSGVLRAGQVLLATNGYTDSLWPGLRQSIIPAFSAIAASDPLMEASAILPLRCAAYEDERVGAYFRVDAQNRLIFGGRGPMRELNRPIQLRTLIAQARRIWPSLRGVRWSHAWSGQLALTRDQYPRIHRLAPSVYAGLGYNGRGVALATVMGQQLAALLCGEDIDMPLTTPAGIRLHRFWRLGARLATTRLRLLDRIGR